MTCVVLQCAHTHSSLFSDISWHSCSPSAYQNILFPLSLLSLSCEIFLSLPAVSPHCKTAWWMESWMVSSDFVRPSLLQFLYSKCELLAAPKIRVGRTLSTAVHRVAWCAFQRASIIFLCSTVFHFIRLSTAFLLLFPAQALTPWKPVTVHSLSHPLVLLLLGS